MIDRLIPEAFLYAQLRKPDGLFGHWLGKQMAQRHTPLYTWTLPMMQLQPTDWLLDIGCGSGLSTRMLAAEAPHGYVLGIDYSRTMVRQAHQRNAALLRAGRLEFAQGSVAALPCSDQQFDRVLAVETFFFWPGPLNSLHEVYRVLKPGGLVAITMEISKDAVNPQAAEEAASFDAPVYSRAEMEDLLHTAAFRQVHVESLPEQGLGWLCALAVK